MTHTITRNRATRSAVSVVVLLVLALVASGWDGGQAASRPAARPLRVLVVVDTATARDPGLAEAARAALARAIRTGRVTGELRVTSSPTEQLSVTHYFAARRFDVVVGAGLDAAVAVAPVRRAFPATRFVLTQPRQLPAAVARLTS